MTFDISSVEFDDTFELILNHPKTDDPFMVDVEVDNGEGGKKTVQKPMSITLYAPSTKEYRAAQAVSRQRYQKSFHRGKSTETPDQEAARAAQLFAAVTISFNNFTYKGMDAKDREAFRACYLDPKSGWITRQVNEELEDWGKSMKDGPSN